LRGGRSLGKRGKGGGKGRLLGRTKRT
jgi:hypothetical protein